jgi:hypothetical protein
VFVISFTSALRRSLPTIASLGEAARLELTSTIDAAPDIVDLALDPICGDRDLCHALLHHTDLEP